MFQKTFKSQKGFTLVEVIVVAVIVAVLAAVASGIYISYTKNARDNTAKNAASAVLGFCGACVNNGGTVPDQAETDGKSDVTITCTNPDASEDTKITLPKDIKISITTVGDGGTITAIHVKGDSTWSMTY
jgi:prepilin-type N-terminal cleavage/methylation domain-containing protein